MSKEGWPETTEEEIDQLENLAHKAVQEIRDRQAEMSDCNHHTISHDGEGDRDGWFCDSCDMEFTPSVFSGSYEIRDIELSVSVSENSLKDDTSGDNE